MCALAGLPARAAARVRALEAGAPVLAASAACPLRLVDLLDAAALLTPLLVPDLVHTAAFECGITLREARYFYEGGSAAVASTMRAWRGTLRGATCLLRSSSRSRRVEHRFGKLRLCCYFKL